MSPRPKKKPEEPKGTDPFSKGQIFSDMKVVAYDEKSVRPVHFVYVKRGAMVHVPSETKGAPGKVEWSDVAVARDPHGKIIWNTTDIHMMTAADFKRHTQGRTMVGVGVL